MESIIIKVAHRKHVHWPKLYLTTRQGETDKMNVKETAVT